MPQAAKPVRRKFGIPDGVRDTSVPQVGLQRPGISPFVGQGVPAGMPEHVRVSLDLKSR